MRAVAKLSGYRHTALPDRIEAASWAAAALATRGDIYVRGAHQPDMTTFLNTFRKVGGAFDIDADGIRFYHPGEPLHSIALETAVHPGFMTDWQQPLRRGPHPGRRGLSIRARDRVREPFRLHRGAAQDGREHPGLP